MSPAQTEEWNRLVLRVLDLESRLATKQAKLERTENVGAEYVLREARLGIQLELERAAHEKTKAALAAMTNVAVSGETYVQLAADLDDARARAERFRQALTHVRDEQVAEGEQFSAAHFRVRAIARASLADDQLRPEQLDGNLPQSAVNPLRTAENQPSPTLPPAPGVR